jgi:DNA primase
MSTVDDIKQRLDIVELIGGYVTLQKAGHNHKGLCPFHGEKTPSFIVFPDTQTWHCFGACSTGGDVFTFIMRQEGLDFTQALRLLAARAGVELAPLSVTQIALRDELDRLRALNAAAAAYYHRLLVETPAGEAARGYLQRRGVQRETMRAFQLGYAPDQWHGLQEHLRAQRYTVEEMLEVGVLTKNDAGNIYDRFRERILFPVRDERGHVIGFGGRALGEGQPKYLNTPDSPLFDKGSALYGFDLARASIRDSETAIVVEGYMDVVIPHQCGVTNVVACMGTALTGAHIDALKRITRTLILALDADEAGLRAVERGAETARQGLARRVTPVISGEGLIRYEERLDAEIRVLALPEGYDPDELILQDRARWDRLVAEALPVAEFLYRQALQSADLTTAKGKRAVVDRLLPLLAAIDNPVERSHYVQRLAQAVRVEERALLPELRRLRGEGGARPLRRAPAAAASDPDAPAAEAPAAEAHLSPAQHLEGRCLALLLASPTLLPEVMTLANLSPDTLQDARHQQILAALMGLAQDEAAAPREILAQRLDSESYARVELLLRQLQAGPPLSPDMIREDLFKGAMRLRKLYLTRLIAELKFMQQDAQDQGPGERPRELCEMIDRLTRDYLQIDQRYYAATFGGRRQSREQTSSGHA